MSDTTTATTRAWTDEDGNALTVQPPITQAAPVYASRATFLTLADHHDHKENTMTKITTTVAAPDTNNLQPVSAPLRHPDAEDVHGILTYMIENPATYGPLGPLDDDLALLRARALMVGMARSLTGADTGDEDAGRNAEYVRGQVELILDCTALADEDRDGAKESLTEMLMAQHPRPLAEVFAAGGVAT